MNGSRTASGRFNPSRLVPEVSPRGNGTRDVPPILSILAIFKKKKNCVQFTYWKFNNNLSISS